MNDDSRRVIRSSLCGRAVFLLLIAGVLVVGCREKTEPRPGSGDAAVLPAHGAVIGKMAVTVPGRAPVQFDVLEPDDRILAELGVPQPEETKRLFHSRVPLPPGVSQFWCGVSPSEYEKQLLATGFIPAGELVLSKLQLQMQQILRGAGPDEANRRALQAHLEKQVADAQKAIAAMVFLNHPTTGVTVRAVAVSDPVGSLLIVGKVRPDLLVDLRIKTAPPPISDPPSQAPSPAASQGRP